MHAKTNCVRHEMIYELNSNIFARFSWLKKNRVISLLGLDG